jgi:hypothetical protein
MGKGDARRPTQISDEIFAQNMARWQTPKPKKEPYVPPPLITVDDSPTGEQPAPSKP